MTGESDKIFLRFHGRIIDSLGTQMYQSPVAAVSELIANAWDADATYVNIDLPENLSGDPAIVVRDNGIGMTFAECQDFYLSVGRNRRIDEYSDKSPNGRPVLGRKGIGKFAGFGIAGVLQIDTTSNKTGERTVFDLVLRDLRSDSYIGTNAKEVPVHSREPESEARKAQSGTIITMKKLSIRRTPSKSVFLHSMAQKFLVNQFSHTFRILINGEEVPDDNALTGVEFDFPGDHTNEEQPDGLRIENNFGYETVGNDEIAWRVRFTKEPIGTEELRGISVFCGIKLAQLPFFFNMSGGLSGQHWQQYVSGQVQADYLDRITADVITVERQRINWELPECRELETWGQERVRSLLSIWKGRREERKLRQIEKIDAPFAKSQDVLLSSESPTVVSALKRVSAVEALSDGQIANLSSGIVKAMKGERLRELIEDVSSVENMDEEVLLSLLSETKTFNALHVGEAVKVKVEITEGLRKRIKERDLENAVRNYIAENPWLLSPQWETFKVETSVRHLIEETASEAKLDTDNEAGNKRADLVLSSGRQLLVVEFMRPGLTLNREHVDKFQEYMDVLRSKIKSSTDHDFEIISGLLVVDRLNRRAGMERVLNRMARDDMKVIEWKGLLSQAETQWKEFLNVLVSRAPQDERLTGLRE